MASAPGGDGDVTPSEDEAPTDLAEAIEDLREWARLQRACWEIAPLREMVQGQGVQRVGYVLHLFAEVELGSGHAGAETHHDRLRQVAELLRSCASPLTHVDVEPFDAAFHLRSETSFAPEVQLTVRATPAHADRRLTPEEVNALIVRLEERLKDLGFRPKAWGREDAAS